MGITAASIAVWNRDRVLLIQRAKAPFKGYWTLPGGRLEGAESTVEAVIRELYEETGLSVKNPLHAGQHRAGSTKNGFELEVFTARYHGGQPTGSNEITQLGWYRYEQIKALETTPGLGDVLDATLRVLANH